MLGALLRISAKNEYQLCQAACFNGGDKNMFLIELILFLALFSGESKGRNTPILFKSTV